MTTTLRVLQLSALGVACVALPGCATSLASNAAAGTTTAQAANTRPRPQIAEAQACSVVNWRNVRGGAVAECD